ncbi:hypothetical protein DN752_23790 [Echinicola strongylocentroti]|uniref:Uncharacterized protein n=1 Tax=Echinicola strongylocentroti TaxID=1795355 RepID=A0A2Z4IPR3_9BACT|nr:hypothetical protein DN752_23790 [Echinicola strongylocentroti]
MPKTKVKRLILKQFKVATPVRRGVDRLMHIPGLTSSWLFKLLILVIKHQKITRQTCIKQAVDPRPMLRSNSGGFWYRNERGAK